METFKKCWSEINTFDWKMYLALCLLALVPAIYQTAVTKLITVNSNLDAFDIVGQMEWFDLIDETIRSFIDIPMYSVLSKAKNNGCFSSMVYKTGIVAFVLYALFSLGVFFYGVSLINYMNPNEINLTSAYRYLSLETIAFMIGVIFCYTSVVFLVIDKARYMYLFLVVKITLSLVSDFILIPNLGINGIAVSNIIANSIMAVVTLGLLAKLKHFTADRITKDDLPYFKAWARTGVYAGGQQLLDNIIYALMIVRMVNAVAESGIYWVANNFIWGWLLIPVGCLSEIIRKDAGKDGYKLKQFNYYSITMAAVIIWFLCIPFYTWFFKSVEGLNNSERVFEIVIKNLGFYVAYAFSQIPDAVFVGMGKTKYNAINSLLCNIVYYGIWFILYLNHIVIMNMDMIIVMFGLGNVVHWAVSLIEEKYFLQKELKKPINN